MTDRSIVSRLRLEVAGYLSGAKQAERATRDIGRAMDDTARQSQKSSQQQATGMARLAESAKKNEQAWTTVGTAVTAFGALAAAGVGTAVSAYADFDAQMSSVQAATMETTDNMERLREAAIQAGADTVFSATEAAQGIEELAKAGVSTTDILDGGLNGALDLAASGNISVAEAAETAASALTQFKLEGNQASHVADLLAAGAAKAQGGVSDMGAALNQSGLVAAQMGLDIEETVGSLTAFASAGLVGSDAGTSFRSMLLRLANPTKESAELMDELGLSFYDAQGDFVGMEGVAGQLQDRMSGLDQETRNAALATLFGQDAIRAASILYSEGAEGVASWTDEVDSSGFAAQQAATRMDNLKGDLEGLSGSWETLMIRMGEGADAPLRGIVQSLDGVVDWLGRLPTPVLNAATGLGSVAAATGLVAGGFLLAAPRVFDVVDGFRKLNDTHPGVVSGMGKAAKAVGLLTAAMTAVHLVSDFVQGMEDAKYTAEELAGVFDDLPRSTDVVGDAFGDIFKPEDIARGHDFRDLLLDIADPSFMDSFNEWSGSLLGMETGFGKTADRLREYGDILGTVAESDLPAATERFRAFWEEAGGDETAGRALLTTMPAFRDALAGIANEMGIATDEANLLAIATGELTPEMEEAGISTEEFQVATEAAQEAVAEWRETVAGAAEAFGGIGDAYQGVIDKNIELAEETAAATEDAEDSWEDFYNGTTVSMAEWITQLEEQAAAMAEWKAHVLEATAQIREQLPADMQAAADAMIDELVALGPEGAAQLALFTDASAEEKVRLIEAWQGTGSQIGTDLATELEAARAAGQTTVTVEVQADPTEAYTTINGVVAATNAETGTITIDGENMPAAASLEQILGRVGASAEDITINGDPLPAGMTLGELLYRVRNSKEPITIDGRNGPGKDALQALVNLVNRSGGNIKVGAAASSSFFGQLSGLAGIINGTSANIRVGVTRTFTTAQLGPQVADGGLFRGGVKAYADGGIDAYGNHVPRVPQIAQGGRYVMWAEQETGWESYISGKPGMRARNLRVWADTGRLLGVPGFADGALRGTFQQTAAAAVMPAVNVAAPSLDGARISGRLDIGGQLVELIDGRITAHGEESAWDLAGRR